MPEANTPSRAYQRWFSLLLWAGMCLLVRPCWGQNEILQGIVKDSSGAAIERAEVRYTDSSGQESITATNGQGGFRFDPLKFPGILEVRAKGFETVRREIDGTNANDFVVAMAPSARREDVVVSAARTEVRLADTPGSTVLLSETDMMSTPALRPDDALRQVPGFSLFRRSGSRTANASAQGVSLRGLGGSAASRALVLVDGISIIDPFGAWVNWDRIPHVALANVEVYRGGTSNLYGSSALGGVVQFHMREPEAPSLIVEGSYGNEVTPDLSVWTGTKINGWTVSSSAELFRTDGYILVPDDLRGTVDTAANSENASVYARVGRDLGAAGHIFFRGNFFTEYRHNGTSIQTNDTNLGEAALGLDQRFGSKDSLSVRLYGEAENYNQRFSAIAPDRASEILTNIQHVPEQIAGGAGQWTHLIGGTHTLVGGVDFNQVIGSSREVLFTGLNQGRLGGGRQRTAGFFGEDIIRFRQWTVILAGRLDHWENFRGELITTPLSGSPDVTHYPDRTENAFSPRISLLRTISDNVSLTASVYRAFRAPSLNELYRTFRVGNVVTSNNAALTAERLTGGEAGLNITGLSRRIDVRGNFFWSEIADPIANVTVDSTSDPIQRIKENLGRTRSRGVEIDSVWKLSRDVQISAGYAYTNATVASYPGNPGGVDLTGLDVPQVPRDVFTWEARYWNPSRFLLSVQGRFIGRQFDDDQNRFSLDSFYSMDVEVGRGIGRRMQVFVAAENVLNHRYQVARTPVLNLGPPAMVRVGLRFEFPGSK